MCALALTHGPRGRPNRGTRQARAKPQPKGNGSVLSRIRPGSGLAGILLLSLTLRLWGIHDRLPDPSLQIDPIRDTTIDETDRREMAYAWDMWRGGLRPLDLNPHSGEWPGCSFYLTLLLQGFYRLSYSLGTGDWGAQA